MATAGNLVINLMGNTQHLAKSLAKGKTMVKAFGTQGTAALSRFGSRATAVFGAVGTAAKKMAGVLASTGMIMGQVLVVAAGMSLSKLISFDDAIRAAGARARATEAELAALSERARTLGRTTSFTATEVANLMEKLGQGGFSVPEINKMTSDVMNLARATGTDAALAAELMSTTMRIFGIEAANAGRVADVFTGVANRTLTSVEDLAEGWKFAAKPAKDLGMDLEETAAMMGTLSQMGLKGSIAGTAIRRLAAVSATQARKLEKNFGVAFKDAAGNARPLIEVMRDISQATSELGSADRMTKFFEAFGLRGVTATSGLADNFVDTDALVAALRGVEGEADATAKKMDAGFGGTWRKFKSALEGLALTFGDKLVPGATIALDTMRESFNGWSDWVKENWTALSNKIAEWLLIIGTTWEWTWDNAGSIFNLFALKAALGIVSFANKVVYFFLEVIPYAIEYFGRNSTTLLIDAFMYIANGFSNMIDNMKTLWDSLLEWIKTGKFEPDLKGFGDGFRRTLIDNEAFEVPDRIKGTLEKELESTVGNLEATLQGSLDDKIKDRVTELRRMQDEAAAKKLDDTKPADPTGGGDGDGEGSGSGPGGEVGTAPAGAQMRGSAEAVMTFLRATGARTQEMQLAVQKKQLKEAREAARHAREMARRTPVEINVVDAP